MDFQEMLVHLCNQPDACSQMAITVTGVISDASATVRADNGQT